MRSFVTCLTNSFLTGPTCRVTLEYDLSKAFLSKLFQNKNKIISLKSNLDLIVVLFLISLLLKSDVVFQIKFHQLLIEH